MPLLFIPGLPAENIFTPANNQFVSSENKYRLRQQENRVIFVQLLLPGINFLK